MLCYRVDLEVVLTLLILGAVIMVAVFAAKAHLKRIQSGDDVSFSAVTVPLVIYGLAVACGGIAWSHSLPEALDSTPVGAALAFIGTGALFFGIFAVPMLGGNFLGWIAASLITTLKRSGGQGLDGAAKRGGADTRNR